MLKHKNVWDRGRPILRQDYDHDQGCCKKDPPKSVVFFIVPLFGFRSTLKLEKQFLSNLKNIFNVYNFKKKIP